MTNKLIRAIKLLKALRILISGKKPDILEGIKDNKYRKGVLAAL